MQTKRLREPKMQEYLECALLYHSQNDKTKVAGHYLSKEVTIQDLDILYMNLAAERIAKRMCNLYGSKKQVFKTAGKMEDLESSNSELKAENDDLKEEITLLEDENRALQFEIRRQKFITKLEKNTKCIACK